MLSLKLIRLFVEMRTNDLLPQADLLLEMLDAQDSLDLNNSFLSMNTDISSLTSDGNPNLPTNNSNMDNTTAPSTINNSTVQPTNYQATGNFNPRQEATDQAQNVNDLNSKCR